MTGIILLFIMSIFAWINGDDSMKGFVIVGVILLVCCWLLGSCGA